LAHKRILLCSPFVFHITSHHKSVIDNLKLLYGERVVLSDDYSGYIDYYVSITHSGGIRRIVNDQARFLCDKMEPFKPLNRSQAFAMLEWGLNWVIAAHEVSHLIIHSAVLAKGGKAVVFPAPPGSGKSTLTAFLSRNGWRLLSDEMALITPLTSTVTPFVRPVCLKNDSINLVKSWYPDDTFSTIAKDTHKGDVVHMAPGPQAVQTESETAEVVGIVFPKYNKNVFFDVYDMDQATAYTALAENAFNYSVLQEKGIKSVVHLVENAASFEVEYNNLEELDSFLTKEVLGAEHAK
jgi:HprK-related kinase A